ncbi:MAG: hypothetical protein U0414_24445 [Polyangiaceae bacterium]
MIGAVEIVAAATLTFSSVLCLLSARGANGLRRRIVNTPTVPARELGPGVGELVGRFQAVGEPLRSIDGHPVVAWSRALRITTQSGGKRRTRKAPTVAQACEVELVDDSGSVILVIENFLLYANERVHVWNASQAVTRPDIWRLVTESAGQESKIVEVRVTEKAIPVGALGFVSGHVSAEAPPAPTHAYRSNVARAKLEGTSDRPLVVSAWKEDVVLGILGRPILWLRLMAAVCLLLAAAVVASSTWISRSMLGG